MAQADRDPKVASFQIEPQYSRGRAFQRLLKIRDSGGSSVAVSGGIIQESAPERIVAEKEKKDI